jgi:hypothetical protein
MDNDTEPDTNMTDIHPGNGQRHGAGHQYWLIFTPDIDNNTELDSNMTDIRPGHEQWHGNGHQYDWYSTRTWTTTRRRTPIWLIFTSDLDNDTEPDTNMTDIYPDMDNNTEPDTNVTDIHPDMGNDTEPDTNMTNIHLGHGQQHRAGHQYDWYFKSNQIKIFIPITKTHVRVT